MIVNEQTVHRMNVGDIRMHYREDGYFFNRSTMRFFGDKLSSFGVRSFNGERYMYRKPTAIVNVMGRYTRAGWQFFSAWKVVPLDAENVDLLPTTQDEENALKDHLMKIA
jgi:hypothetical protein